MSDESQRFFKINSTTWISVSSIASIEERGFGTTQVWLVSGNSYQFGADDRERLFEAAGIKDYYGAEAAA
ncbi:hypothetical protein [Shinella sp. JR1-6]|uniref:hypothetical protein n=1 Tax=Shinella sp. JR1-6 TaxID=2527671 RepID=UPI00102D551F|nr:hypothetical protein [Shinella sp. JR1-6]TAA48899.1 hypothetical protein EXZ48_34695 [Shinella sp. JR1-6]